MPMKPRASCILVALAALCADASARADGKLVVHEWSTFTCVQNEAGKLIGGINVEGAPVPEFLHETAPDILVPTDPGAPTPLRVARCHPDVTMQVDAAVMNFYPDEGFDSPIDVRVSFWSGLFTHLFPDAAVSRHPASERGPFDLGAALHWSGQIKPADDASPVGAPAWLASRASEAAPLEVNGERAKFLFYRGIGLLFTGPLKVSRNGPELVITAIRDEPQIDQLWLVDVRPDGRLAFRVLRPFNSDTAFLVRAGHHFAPEDYNGENLSALRTALAEALIAAGLFEAEAGALLNSAQASYFASPGLRLFFLRPGGSTRLDISVRGDRCCPDKLPEPRPRKLTRPEVTRVMLTRIEIVSPAQAALLAEIAGTDSALGAEAAKASRLPKSEIEWSGLHDVYVQLGPFRNALILDEQKRRATPRLQAFIEHFHLEAHPRSHHFVRQR
jgi:hypothetical protein